MACQEHCYCQRVDVGHRPHVKCCNCGHQKLAAPPRPPALADFDAAIAPYRAAARVP